MEQSVIPNIKTHRNPSISFGDETCGLSDTHSVFKKMLMKPKEA